jgi:AcrR family transcriptional regulator
MDAALRVFSERGVHPATVSDITDAAGVAKGTFYLYFDSKEHVVAALRQRFVEEAVAAAARLFERVGVEDWWALCDATIGHIVDFTLAHREDVKIFTHERSVTSGTRDVMAECERQMNEMMAAGIRAGIEAGVFRKVEPALAAAMLRHSLEGPLVESIVYGTPVDRDALVQAGKELARHYLAAD